MLAFFYASVKGDRHLWQALWPSRLACRKTCAIDDAGRPKDVRNRTGGLMPIVKIHQEI
jgi:hypothetical protein